MSEPCPLHMHLQLSVCVLHILYTHRCWTTGCKAETPLESGLISASSGSCCLGTGWFSGVSWCWRRSCRRKTLGSHRVKIGVRRLLRAVLQDLGLGYLMLRSDHAYDKNLDSRWNAAKCSIHHVNCSCICPKEVIISSLILYVLWNSLWGLVGFDLFGLILVCAIALRLAVRLGWIRLVNNLTYILFRLLFCSKIRGLILASVTLYLILILFYSCVCMVISVLISVVLICLGM